jgi:hypothetical protein
MQPGLGFGAMVRRLANRLAVLFVITTTHLAHRFGLYAGVIATAVAAGAAPALAAGLAAGMAEPTIADRVRATGPSSPTGLRPDSRSRWRIAAATVLLTGAALGGEAAQRSSLLHRR